MSGPHMTYNKYPPITLPDNITGLSIASTSPAHGEVVITPHPMPVTPEGYTLPNEAPSQAILYYDHRSLRPARGCDPLVIALTDLSTKLLEETTSNTGNIAKPSTPPQGLPKAILHLPDQSLYPYRANLILQTLEVGLKAGPIAVYHALVPRLVKLGTESGEIVVKGVTTNKLDATTISGDIITSENNVTGHVGLSTETGRIIAKGFGAYGLEARTISGDIITSENNVTGQTTLITESGVIMVTVNDQGNVGELDDKKQNVVNVENARGHTHLDGITARKVTTIVNGGGSFTATRINTDVLDIITPSHEDTQIIIANSNIRSCRIYTPQASVEHPMTKENMVCIRTSQIKP